MNREEYDERQAMQQARYLELIADYKSRVRGNAPGDAFSAALLAAECAMLDNPPLSEAVDPDGKPSGIWKPRAKGLIHACRLPKPECRPFQADFSLIPTSEWQALVGGEDDVDMRRFVPDGMMLDQDAVGSCASEGMSGSIMASRVKAGQEPVKLNPWFAYHTVSGGSDQGSSLQDNVAFAQKYGVCSQAVYGRDKGWRAKPSEEAYEDALKYRLTELWSIGNWESFGTALLLGLPVYYGYSGHAIWATKLLDTGRFEYCNSWSKDWGDRGFGTLAKSKIVWNYGAYAFRVATESEG